MVLRILKWLVAVIAILAVLALLAGQAGLFRGMPPSDLGVRDGKLKPPSMTENSVTSQAFLYPDHPQRQYADIAPLPVKGGGKATLARIKAIVETMNGAEIIKSAPDYLYARFTTRFMKFVDDVEFWFDPVHQVIQVRSASRVGRSDLGVNRKRIEAIREALAANLKPKAMKPPMDADERR